MTEHSTMENSVDSQEHAATEKKTSRTRRAFVKCPHCGEELPRSVEKEIAREIRRKAAVSSGAGRRPSPRACPKCGKMKGARELRLHEPICKGKLMFPEEEDIILAVLSDQGEFSAVDIWGAAGIAWKLLYPALRRLEIDNKITGRWDESDQTKREKNRLYRLSDPRKGKP
jgi:endogenous inhibitor of DNA gyrase (YacG/DUF329 family)